MLYDSVLLLLSSWVVMSAFFRFYTAPFYTITLSTVQPKQHIYQDRQR